uniref:HAT C-terminal dimerisation domain-containing protein n=1 Tax=Erpetoichthys calabaricus TaxID=27687 RepID=A0A8C4S176_ERPCA
FLPQSKDMQVSMRPSKLTRHIETKHSHFTNKTDFFQRKLLDMKSSKNIVSHFININENAVYASYLINLRIARAGKPHTIGEDLVLPSIKDAVGAMFGEKEVKEIERIPLSNNTVARRIDEMAEWAEDELIRRVVCSKYYMLQLDESTDVQGLSQLLVFVRYIWQNDAHEDILFCKPISRGTAEEIFNAIDSYIKEKGLQWKNCFGICTDGARAMCGKNSSVVTRVLKQSPCALWTHCSLHREALVSKALPNDFKTVLNTAVKIVNYIKTKPLQARLFQKLCEEMGSLHTSLLLHTEVRWLSRGKVLTRLVELRNEVTIYLEGKTEYIESLLDKEFILKLTYLADISKLNELNLYLQGSNESDIFVVHDRIRAFMKKLMLWKSCIEDGKYDCFETLETFIIENQVQPKTNVLSAISTHLSLLKNNFDAYFGEDMKKLDSLNWICNPFQDRLPSSMSTKASEELIDLSEDTSLKNSFNRKQLMKFWHSVAGNYPCLFDEAIKVLLPFSTSYLCEAGFSAMISIKTKYRNKLDVSNSLRLKVTKIEVDAKAVMIKNRKQIHPSH